MTVVVTTVGLQKELQIKYLLEVRQAVAQFIQIAVSQTTFACLTQILMLHSLVIMVQAAAQQLDNRFATITVIILAHVVRGTVLVTVLI